MNDECTFAANDDGAPYRPSLCVAILGKETSLSAQFDYRVFGLRQVKGVGLRARYFVLAAPLKLSA
jgi:hypothetical protein